MAAELYAAFTTSLFEDFVFFARIVVPVAEAWESYVMGGLDSQRRLGTSFVRQYQCHSVLRRLGVEG